MREKSKCLKKPKKNITKKDKHLGTRKSKGGEKTFYPMQPSSRSSSSKPSSSKATFKFPPKQNEDPYKYINRMATGANNNLQKMGTNYGTPQSAKLAGNVKTYATNIHAATNVITSNPKIKQNLDYNKINNLQDATKLFNDHAQKLHSSIINGDYDESISKAHDMAKKSATALTNILQDKDVQKNVANSGKDLYNMSTNLFSMGSKYAKGQLTYKDAIQHSLAHLGNASNLAVNSFKTVNSAYKAANK